MKVAVIGAGISGLIATKICRDYGFEVVCFEKLHDFGGLWRFKPKSTVGEASVMKSTIINTSKEMMAFSDFPPPANFPCFMHHSYVILYFTMYVEHFNLKNCIKFGTQVQLVKRSENYNETGRWDVIFKDSRTDEVLTETFDGIFVATGHHAFPYCPKFDGIEKFRGQITHSHSYKDQTGYDEKNVLVIGLGNSGGDIAVELSRVASKVNDDLPNRILCGEVIVKPNVSEFLDDSGVRFDDGSEIHGISDVIMCTGFNVAFPVLERGVVAVDDQNTADLYKFMYPPQLDQWPTLCIIGLVQPLGAIMPISEMQARFHCEVLATKNAARGDDCLRLVPEGAAMRRQIAADRAVALRRYGAARRHTVQVDFVPYIDDLAGRIGAMPPSIWRCAFVDRDWVLARTLGFGPSAPYQYRLQGPHVWDGARDALLTSWGRALAQLRAGRRGAYGEEAPMTSSMHFAIWIVILAIFFLFFSIFF